MVKVPSKGLVQVFTGNGKGKTTAALGTVLRAAGHGFKVFIVFFMKGNYEYGEFATLPKLPNVEVKSFGSRRIIDRQNVSQTDVEQAQMALTAAREAINSRQYDLVVMDEVNVAIACELIPVDDVVNLIKTKPPEVELILTGRYANEKVLAEADLVTEMLKVKHPFDAGITARKGIEY